MKTHQGGRFACVGGSLVDYVMLCSFCFSKGLRYKMIETVSRCKKCVSRGRSYDGNGVPLSSLQNIRREHQRLEREELFVEERFLKLQRRHLDA